MFDVVHRHSTVLHTDIWKFIWLSDEDDKIEPYLNDYRRIERETDAVNYMLAAVPYPRV